MIGHSTYVSIIHRNGKNVALEGMACQRCRGIGYPMQDRSLNKRILQERMIQ